LGEHDISINRMRQYDHQSTEAPVTIVTHDTDPERLNTALAAIDASDVTLDAPVALRIEAL